MSGNCDQGHSGPGLGEEHFSCHRWTQEPRRTLWMGSPGESGSPRTLSLPTPHPVSPFRTPTWAGPQASRGSLLPSSAALYQSLPLVGRASAPEITCPVLLLDPGVNLPTGFCVVAAVTTHPHPSRGARPS